MEFPRRRFLHLAAGAAALPAVSRARAQSYPLHPITIVVPFAAGGPNDTIARVVAERMRATLGQPIIIENTGGANGSIGVGRVVRAPADGYTLSLGSNSSHVLNGAIYALGYDLLKDLQPVSPLTNEPGIIISKKAVPATDLAGLIAWLKANPDKASAGIAGIGNIFHLAGILFQQVTGTRFQFVPYRGEAPVMQDLVAGLLDISFNSPSGAIQQLRAGNVKAYAVTAKSRLAVAPDIPTVDEVGLVGFHISNWRGVWAPKGTPSALIIKLNVAVMDALSDARVRARLADLGYEICGSPLDIATKSVFVFAQPGSKPAHLFNDRLSAFASCRHAAQ